MSMIARTVQPNVTIKPQPHQIRKRGAKSSPYVKHYRCALHGFIPKPGQATKRDNKLGKLEARIKIKNGMAIPYCPYCFRQLRRRGRQRNGNTV